LAVLLQLDDLRAPQLEECTELPATRNTQVRKSRSLRVEGVKLLMESLGSRRKQRSADGIKQLVSR